MVSWRYDEFVVDKFDAVVELLGPRISAPDSAGPLITRQMIITFLLIIILARCATRRACYNNVTPSGLVSL